MEWVKIVLDRFEDFFKRAFLPSMGFYFFFILFRYLCDNKILENLKNIERIINEKNFILFFIIFSIGLSYFLNMLHQLIFDNNIKKNYETKYVWTNENKILRELRNKVIDKLKNNGEDILEEYNDYILYQIINKNIDTKRYVDDTKTYGIIFLSYIFTIIFVVPQTKNELCCFIFSISIIIVCLMFDVIKAKYRSRAIRLYINYLKKS